MQLIEQKPYNGSQICVAIPADDHCELQRISREWGVNSVSAVVRAMVRAGLAQGDHPVQPGGETQNPEHDWMRQLIDAKFKDDWVRHNGHFRCKCGGAVTRAYVTDALEPKCEDCE